MKTLTAFSRRHHAKLYHRTQEVAFVGEGDCTRYSGPRRAPNVKAARFLQAQQGDGRVQLRALRLANKRSLKLSVVPALNLLAIGSRWIAKVLVRAEHLATVQPQSPWASSS